MALIALAAAGGSAMTGERMIDRIPVEVRDYLTAGDGLAKAAVLEKYPNVERILNAAATRTAIVHYLASQEPWHDSPGLAVNSLSFLQKGASAEEADVLRALAKHPSSWVRLKMDEYMMAIYYPARDRPHIIELIEKMLTDPDELVRVQAARWIDALKLVSEMRPSLQHWIKFAPERKWNHYESFEIIERVLR